MLTLFLLVYFLFLEESLGFTFFVTGIFTRGKLGLTDIIFQYIHCDEICKAINILSSMDWDTLGHQCFISMSAIVNHLLRQKLTPEREGQTWNVFHKLVVYVYEVGFIESVIFWGFFELCYWRPKDKNVNALLKLTRSDNQIIIWYFTV